jgi:hypothetical protein
MWALLTSIPALIKLIGEFIGIFNMVRRALQKDPIKEIAKDAEKQKDAEKRTEETDDTSGTFGGTRE